MLPSEISSIDELCIFLQTERQVFDNVRKTRDQSYAPLLIPKRGGAYRLVYKVTDDTFKNILRRIGRALSEQREFPECVQGFRRGRSIRTNASHHLGKKIVINLDIRDFFATISSERVKQVFLDAGFTMEFALILTELTTVDGTLATGFSPSPVLANIVCGDLDADMLALAEKFAANYTRYGDDITISADQTVPTLPDIEALIAKHGFAINFDKYRVQRKGQSQYVTGLTVCDPAQPHIPRRIKRRLRLESYYIKKFGANNHLAYLANKSKVPMILNPFNLRHSLGGWIFYISGIDGKFANWLMRFWSI